LKRKEELIMKMVIKDEVNKVIKEVVEKRTVGKEIEFTKELA
jgi:hypothetical protein